MFTRFTIQATSAAYDALALYVAYTHAAAAFDYAPRLLLTSAEKRSGKTRTMEVIEGLCCAPLVTANASPAGLVRSIDPERPRTLLLDEADTIFGMGVKTERSEELRGLINAGFQKGTPFIRATGTGTEVMELPTFSPVVMAAIGVLPDTIQDRAVNIRLRRRKPTERVEPLRFRVARAVLHPLRAELGAWIETGLDGLRDAEPETPLTDRAADLWEPLLAVADLAGGDWPNRARTAAYTLTRHSADDDATGSVGRELLHDIRTVTSYRQGDFIPTADLLTLLLNIEDSRWQEEALTGRRLSDRLRPYGIMPKRTKTARGYDMTALADVFERYLPDPEADDNGIDGNPCAEPSPAR